MNTAKTLAAALAATVLATGAFAQGSLTPPGAPAPTMKTLDQVEPRTPIFQTGGVINNSGSYYLTTNIITSGLTSGIQIAANNVSLDLCGFTINGASGTGNGISISPGMDNVLVHNGSICDCNHHGISADLATHCKFRNLRIINNGRYSILYYGITAGIGTQVEHCWIADNGSGLGVCSNSKVTNNEITDNRGDGLHLTDDGTYIANNIVKNNGDNYDLAAGNQLNILLCEIPETLEWPCSVKLAGTLTCTNTGVNGITVAANDVTIDLDGHALVGPGASSRYGIYQDTAYRNLTVKNGKAVHWENANKAGIYVCGTSTILSGLQASTNYVGIYMGESSVISDCTASYNSDDGIYVVSGNISDCATRRNGGIGIYAEEGSTISGCMARNNDGTGIHAHSGITVSGCTARGNGGNGIYAHFCCTVSGCVAQFNTGDGIKVYSDSFIANCVCGSNGHNGDSSGIHTIGYDNCIDGNIVTDNDRGIYVESSGNMIVHNSASGNATDYNIHSGNILGTIQTTIVGAGAWDNFEF